MYPGIDERKMAGTTSCRGGKLKVDCHLGNQLTWGCWRRDTVAKEVVRSGGDCKQEILSYFLGKVLQIIIL